ncbi:hypothetical protein K502DRAFT_291814 [Neoconidiobolus thromboides FSU 785]|nr:hypothetical protein K502DRAFT_291814 [Neoconidiobolus thromboides FSU 785]
MSDYKARKEEFVSGLKGSSIISLWKIVGDFLISKKVLEKVKTSSSYLHISKWAIFDFISLVLPLLFFMNGLNHLTTNFNFFGLIIILLHITVFQKKSRKATHNVSNTNQPQNKILNFITVYRSLLMMLTCIGILAVDFHTFPRFFAKAETYGSSLMDMGVGSFVFSSGIISARAKVDSNSGKISTLCKSLFHSIPLWILGIIRLISVKGIEYQEHVTEYGVHWNFFFTLGCLSIPVVLIEYLSMGSSYIGWGVLTIYQLLLSFSSLESYIISDVRIRGDIVSMNREGLFSLWGYISIFLIAKDVGKVLFSANKGKSYTHLCSYSLLSLIMFCTSYYVFNVEISRRLCNFSYVAWVSAINIILVMVFRLLEDILNIKKAPIIFQAINYNSLFIFLIANLLTGLVNITVPTLDVSDFVAYVILIGYIGAVNCISMVLYLKQIKVIRF